MLVFKLNIEKLRYNLSANADLHLANLASRIDCFFFTSLSKKGKIIFTDYFCWFGRKKIVNVGFTSWHRRDCDRGDLDR